MQFDSSNLYIVTVQVTWSKDGKKIKAKKKDKRVRADYDAETGTQFLEVCQTRHTMTPGEYTLSAENDGGIVACTVSVHVTSRVEKKPPKLEEAPKPQIVREGDTIELLCRVTGQSGFVFLIYSIVVYRDIIPTRRRRLSLSSQKLFQF